jgi:hypothetical protein
MDDAVEAQRYGVPNPFCLATYDIILAPAG